MGRHRLASPSNPVSGLTEEVTDWSSGPPSEVVLTCGHRRLYRAPSPARGDVITCGTCGRPVAVELPVRRSDRHAPRMSRTEILGQRYRVSSAASLLQVLLTPVYSQGTLGASEREGDPNDEPLRLRPHHR